MSANYSQIFQKKKEWHIFIARRMIKHICKHVSFGGNLGEWCTIILCSIFATFWYVWNYFKIKTIKNLMEGGAGGKNQAGVCLVLGGQGWGPRWGSYLPKLMWGLPVGWGLRAWEEALRNQGCFGVWQLVWPRVCEGLQSLLSPVPLSLLMVLVCHQAMFFYFFCTYRW